jgi:hypothetical protein
MFVSLLTDAPPKLDMATDWCPARDSQGKPAPRWLPVVETEDSREALKAT